MSKPKYKGDKYIPTNHDSRRRTRAKIRTKLPRRKRKRWKAEAKLSGSGPWRRAYEELEEKLNKLRAEEEE